MNTTPVTISFDGLYEKAKKLHNDYAHGAFLSSMVVTPEYKEFVNAGRDNIGGMFTLIHYFPCEAMLALADILETNPVRREHRDNMDEMKRYWIMYGKKERYIS